VFGVRFGIRESRQSEAKAKIRSKTLRPQCRRKNSWPAGYLSDEVLFFVKKECCSKDGIVRVVVSTRIALTEVQLRPEIVSRHNPQFTASWQ
jgi:hypothetical protein